MLTTQNQSGALFPICLSEIAERFGFHAIRGMLVLYMTKIFLFADDKSYAIFATFTALLYFTPVIGGWLADQYLGTKKSVLLGGILGTLGYLSLAFLSKNSFYFGLAIVILGSGFYMPNIVCSISQLYTKEQKVESEKAFSLFYAALNIGAFIPPFFTAGIIYKFGWQAGFMVASIAAIISTITYWLAANKYPIVNKAPVSQVKSSFLFPIILIGIFSSIGILSLLIKHSHFANILLGGLCAAFMLFTIQRSFAFTTLERNRILVCLLLTAFSILFWILAEQTALSLAIYTEYHVDRHLGNLNIPTLFFFSLNPFFIITCAPLVSKLWEWLERKNLNPSIPSKFALGTLLMGLGFIILPWGIYYQNSSGQMNLLWIVLSYFVQSIGELFFSPIGLSMMTELAPKKMTSYMVGIWYLATAVAYLLAGSVAQWTSLPANLHFPQLASNIYSSVFGTLGWVTIGLGMVILLFVPLFKKMMNAVPAVV
jgi:POT family proton-dependent oligopeptide transporter